MSMTGQINLERAEYRAHLGSIAIEALRMLHTQPRSTVESSLRLACSNLGGSYPVQWYSVLAQHVGLDQEE